MQRLFRRLRLSRVAPARASRGTLPALSPDRPLYAVGDIHGRADLIDPLLQRIDADVTEQGHTAPQLVFLGDYIDRGDRALDVLLFLHELTRAVPDAVVCLMGNHERMMLDFIDDPAGRGGHWLINGGLQTLASFGIGGLSTSAPVEDMCDAGDALLAALPDGMLAWLRGLPLWHQNGNMVCVHAAMNPARAPDEQSERTLLWGHRDFPGQPREDGLWVVHGHTIVREPVIEDGRICVDTGAYHTGCLTAAAIAGGTCRFL